MPASRFASLLPLAVLALAGVFVFAVEKDGKTGSLPAGKAVPEVVVLTGLRVIDGTGSAPWENTTLVIESGKTAAVGTAESQAWLQRPGVKKVDATGKTVIPGLISNHSHLGLVQRGVFGARQFTQDNVLQALQLYQGYGVTGVMSLGMNHDLLFQIRADQRAGKIGGADVYTAGRGIGVVGGAPPLDMPTEQLARVSTPDEAREAVRQMAAAGVDVLKLWADTFLGKVQKMPPEISKAILEEAKKHQLKVAAHLYFVDDARQLVEDGLEIIAHSIRDQEVSADLAGLMKQRHVAYVPTLALDEAQFIYAEQPAWMKIAAFRAAATPALLEEWGSEAYAKIIASNPITEKNRAGLVVARKNLKALHDAGVLIGFGTDSGANPSRLPGWAEHRELQLYVESGLTPMEAIVCATRNAAQVLGQGEVRGTLEVGKRADFILLAANPLEDISNTTRIEAVHHAGQEVKPAYQY